MFPRRAWSRPGPAAVCCSHVKSYKECEKNMWKARSFLFLRAIFMGSFFFLGGNVCTVKTRKRQMPSVYILGCLLLQLPKSTESTESFKATMYFPHWPFLHIFTYFYQLMILHDSACAQRQWNVFVPLVLLSISFPFARPLTKTTEKPTIEGPPSHQREDECRGAAGVRRGHAKKRRRTGWFALFSDSGSCTLFLVLVVEDVVLCFLVFFLLSSMCWILRKRQSKRQPLHAKTHTVHADDSDSGMQWSTLSYIFKFEILILIRM